MGSEHWHKGWRDSLPDNWIYWYYYYALILWLTHYDTKCIFRDSVHRVPIFYCFNRTTIFLIIIYLHINYHIINIGQLYGDKYFSQKCSTVLFYYIRILLYRISNRYIVLLVVSVTEHCSKNKIQSLCTCPLRQHIYTIIQFIHIHRSRDRVWRMIPGGVTGIVH